MAEPRHKRGESKQDYGTPKPLIEAVKRGLGIKEFAFDLAATKANAKALKYYTIADNALAQDWAGDGWHWLNPPYAHIQPWIMKAYESRIAYDAKIAMLLPASVGSNWWRHYVHNEARVWFLNRRVQFDGAKDVSPKDHAIILYGPWLSKGYHIWDFETEHVNLSEPK